MNDQIAFISQKAMDQVLVFNNIDGEKK